MHGVVLRPQHAAQTRGGMGGRLVMSMPPDKGDALEPGQTTRRQKATLIAWPQNNHHQQQGQQPHTRSTGLNAWWAEQPPPSPPPPGQVNRGEGRPPVGFATAGLAIGKDGGVVSGERIVQHLLPEGLVHLGRWQGEKASGGGLGHINTLLFDHQGGNASCCIYLKYNIFCCCTDIQFV